MSKILIHLDVLVLVMMKRVLVHMELHWKHCQQETDVTSTKGRKELLHFQQK